VSRFVGRTDRQSWHREQAEAALAPARAALERAQVPHQPHWVVGDRAQEICRVAKELGVGHIVMGTARKNSITRMVEDSVTHRVLEDTPVPVEVITGPAVARLERWGVPVAALGAAMMIVFGID
jgi:nucleotide-binding universal stress UspA family protein